MDRDPNKLDPIALELLTGLDSVDPENEDPIIRFKLEAEHLERIGFKLRAITSREDLFYAVDDCLRVAHVLDKRGDATIAGAIQHMVIRALSVGNESHGRVDQISEQASARGERYQQFADEDRCHRAPSVGTPRKLDATIERLYPLQRRA